MDGLIKTELCFHHGFTSDRINEEKHMLEKQENQAKGITIDFFKRIANIKLKV